MAPPSSLRNPFRAGAGVRPPVLAGRDAELSAASNRLDALRAGDPPSRGLLFFGPRGNGKTTLLFRIADDARRLGMRAEDLPAAAFASPRSLVRELQEKAGLTGARLRGAQAAGFGVAAEPGSLSEEVQGLLLAWVERAKSPLVVLLDEAHTVEPEAGRVFFNAVQVVGARALGFLLLAAGTPDAPRRLRKAGTFTERAFERIPVGRLERAATERALAEPARDSGLPLRGEAAAFLAAESQDYPYFIQLLGSAAWKAAAGGHEITVEAARKGASAVRPEIERFYAERFDEACERKVELTLVPLARFFAERGGQIRELDFRRFLRSLPGDGGGRLDTLTDLGILWRGTAGGWEMGIPSFADYLLDLEAADRATGH